MTCLVPGCRMPANGNEPSHHKRFHIVPGCATKGCIYPLDGHDLYTHYGRHHQNTIELEEGVRLERQGTPFRCPQCSFGDKNPKEMREHWVACKVKGQQVAARKRASVGGESPSKRTRDESAAAPYSSVGSLSASSSKHVRPVYTAWTEEEESTLRRLVLASRGNPDWPEIERGVGRTRCRVRWETLESPEDPHHIADHDEPEKERCGTTGQYLKQPSGLFSASVPRPLGLSGGFTPSGKERANEEQQQRLRGEASTSSSVIKLAPVYSPWTRLQEVKLLELAKKYTDKGERPNWREIQQGIGRTKCQRRWKQLIDKGLRTQDGDRRTMEGVTPFLRNGAWYRRWSKEEEALLMKAGAVSNPDWEVISKTIGRTLPAVECRYQKLLADDRRRGQGDGSESDSESSSSYSDDESAPPRTTVAARAPAPGATNHYTPVATTTVVYPETAANDAAFEALERETAAKVSRAIALEAHIRRMRQARIVAAEANRRLAAAIAEDAEFDGAGPRTPSLTASVEPRQDSRPPDRGTSGFAVPPVVLAHVDQRMTATPDEDVKFRPTLPAGSPLTAAYAAGGLIFLGSDSSEEDEDGD